MRWWLVPVWSVVMLAACDGGGMETDADTDTDRIGEPGLPIDTDAPEAPGPDDSYSCRSPLSEQQSVAYSGQVFRQVLISEMTEHLAGMTDRLQSGSWAPSAGDVVEELDFYFAFDSATSGDVGLYLSTTPPALQSTYGEISSDKNLVEKLAGNDTTGQSRDWSSQLVGAGAEGSTTPEGLVRGWFDEIDGQAVAWASGTAPVGPDGETVPAVYVTPDGRDLQQLLEMFLQGALSLSQGADDYLDADIEGKGLLSDHTALVDGKAYTALEHQWDEGFGYFGASRSYDAWSDQEIAGDQARDDDEDGAIDLMREYAFGASVLAGARDRDSSDASPTDLSATAFDAFLAGRLLLCFSAGSELSTDQRTELYGYRDTAVQAWEGAIAATAIHHLNQTLGAMAAVGTDSYDFASHARHWSAMKGAVLSFQFNPRSPMDAEDFATLHGLLGDAPVLATAGSEALEDYADDLMAVRTLLGEAYGFDASNLGDDAGEGGW